MSVKWTFVAVWRNTFLQTGVRKSFFSSLPVVMLYVRYPLSLRDVEDMLHERTVDIGHKTAQFWWNLFGRMFAAEIRLKLALSRVCAAPKAWSGDKVY